MQLESLVFSWTQVQQGKPRQTQGELSRRRCPRSQDFIEECLGLRAAQASPSVHTSRSTEQPATCLRATRRYHRLRLRSCLARLLLREAASSRFRWRCASGRCRPAFIPTSSRLQQKLLKQQVCNLELAFKVCRLELKAPAFHLHSAPQTALFDWPGTPPSIPTIFTWFKDCSSRLENLM